MRSSVARMSASTAREMPLPTEAIIVVNLECNARCAMCGIWKLKQKGTLGADHYRSLPSSLARVGITGGEPFMREDLVDVVTTVHDAANRPQIVISSNGYLTARIVRFVDATAHLRPSVGFGISLDGIGKTHDRIRGTRNAFDKVMRTIAALKERRVNNIRISFTITPDNVREMPDVHQLAGRLGVEFAAQIAHNSELYYHTSTNSIVDPEQLREAVNEVNRRELRSRSVKSWFRAYYNSGTLRHNAGQPRLAACHALKDFFYLSPHGDVYPCLFISKSIGNITHDDFSTIWRSDQAAAVRAEIDGCERCWLMCTARSGLRKEIPKAVRWVAREKLAPRAVQYG
jgi:Fe-coproporphyrin III synthase